MEKKYACICLKIGDILHATLTINIINSTSLSLFHLNIRVFEKQRKCFFSSVKKERRKKEKKKGNVEFKDDKSRQLNVKVTTIRSKTNKSLVLISNTNNKKILFYTKKEKEIIFFFKLNSTCFQVFIIECPE